MRWLEPIDAYCERTSAAFWAEPLNAFTNLAFAFAAAFALALRLRSPRRDGPSLFFVVLVFVIGIGSFLFHTFADRWSRLADVVPIAVFIYAYFGFALRRFFGFGRAGAILATAAFLGASVLAGPTFAPLVGSSAGYVPALLALYGIGGLLVARHHPQGALVLLAGVVFTLSLGWRIADMPACENFPSGTHFLWHVFNAVTLGLLLVAAIRGPDDPPARRRPA